MAAPYNYHILRGDVMQVVEDMVQKQEYKGKFRAIITSPPYFQHRTYGGNKKEIGREKTVEEFVDKLSYVFTICKELLTNDGTLWIVIADTRRKNGKLNVPHKLVKRLVAHGYIAKADYIWFKRNHIASSSRKNFTQAYEYILCLSKEQKTMLEKLGSKHRYDTVWDIPTKSHSGQQHFAIYPEELVERIVKIATKPGDKILDTFAGRGTTGIVCMRTRRHFTGIDLYPSFVKAAKRNIEIVNEKLK